MLIGLCFELKESTSCLVGDNNDVPGQCGDGGTSSNVNDTIYGYAIRVSALVHLICSEGINKDVRTQ